MSDKISFNDLFGMSALNPMAQEYLYSLYEQWLKDSDSVAVDYQYLFNKITLNQKFSIEFHAQDGLVPDIELNFQDRVDSLINSYRLYGHLQDNFNPLNIADNNSSENDLLMMTKFGLHDSDLGKEFIFAKSKIKLKDIISRLQKIYCNKFGFEIMHVEEDDVREWWHNIIESEDFVNLDMTDDMSKNLLKRVIAADNLENYLDKKYPGAKRFSLEGCESLIPFLDCMINTAGCGKVKEVVVGMAHRGRLNFLVNILGKAPADLFAEFEGRHAIDELRSGDVKYHQGFSSDIQTDGGLVHLSLAFNPSHLAIVTAVVGGSAKARQLKHNDTEYNKCVPIVIHGDSAFSGQGVLMEYLNMSQTRAFGVGGTIHIIINNQIGFTTSNPADTRSTHYCSDLAKMINAPVIHVNAEDPIAVHYIAKIAMEFRLKFKRDIVIDLVCYRRHGHNEADEPSVTQPIMYGIINKKPRVSRIFAQHLIDKNVLTEQEFKGFVDEYNAKLKDGVCVNDKVLQNSINIAFSFNWQPFLNIHWRSGYDLPISLEHLQNLGQKLVQLPEDFNIHRLVKRIFDTRLAMYRGDEPLDWGAAELLAYAVLIDSGYNVRLVGQDAQRGTFFHRHATIHDTKNSFSYSALENLDAPGKFRVYDSLLSEEAVLGFEYGISSTDPNTLVIWEAQFGDFVNTAQVVIDQFLSSAEQKWGRFSGITLFLPHGYEGQGPEHSSARLERFLQLCAQDNMQVCVPTSPAQIMNLLLRQMFRPMRRPLVVITPKSFLRHKLAVSTFADILQGKFHLVINDDSVVINKVERVILCSGKVYYDLEEYRRVHDYEDRVALVRLEQLYPFPKEELGLILSSYKQAKTVVWCQEEPKNQGAWYCMNHNFQDCITSTQKLHYAGRSAQAAPAAGVFSLHNKEQASLLKDAFSVE